MIPPAPSTRAVSNSGENSEGWAPSGVGALGWDTAVVVLLVGGFLAWTTLPGLHWHDTGEFAAVAWRLSVAHSPGHPLHALTTRAIQEIPLGDGIFRANLASALAITLALAGLHGLLRRVVPSAPRWAALAAAVTPAVMPAIWLQGVRAEVYGLQLLLAVLCAHLAWSVATGDRRALPALGLAFGLAGANHHLIGVSLVPMAVLALLRARPGLRGWLWGAAGGVVGLGTYALLPLRARAGAEVGWGMPVDLPRLVDTVLAREWVGADPAGNQPIDLIENTQKIAAWTMEQVGLPAAMLLFLGLAVGLLGAWRRARPALVGAAAAVVGVAATKFVTALDEFNPDQGGYLAPMLCALVVLGFVCLAHLPRVGVRGTWAWGAVLLLAAPGFDSGGRQGARAADAYGRAMLAEVPPDGALGAGDYATWFLAWGLRAVEGARPDAALVFQGRAGADWLWERLALQRPDLAVARSAWPEGPPWSAITVFEPGPRGAPSGMLALSEAEDFEGIAGAHPDLDTRRFVALQHLNRALVLGSRGAVAAARAHLAAARVLVGDDPELAAAERRLAPASENLRGPLDARQGGW